MVFITSGGNFRVSRPTLDRFGPTLKILKASISLILMGWFGPSIGILHRAYTGAKKIKKGHFWSNCFLIEIDAPMFLSLLEVTLGSPYPVSNHLRSPGDAITPAPSGPLLLG